MRPHYVIASSIFFVASILFAKNGLIHLNTSKTHLMIFTEPDLPTLEFRDLKKLEIKIRLDHKGLFVGSKLVCSWPGGEYSTKDEENMVLGYITPVSEFIKANAKVKYEPCPADVPIKSTWGDGGTGAAALFIEVEKVNDNRADVRYRGEILHLDLSKIKGKYRVNPPGSLSNEPGD